MAALGISLVQTKIYRATARITAVPARPDWGLGNSAKDLLRNFVNNINTHDMANRVIAREQLDMNSYDLLAEVTVSAEPENFIIRIDAKDRDPGDRQTIAKTHGRPVRGRPGRLLQHPGQEQSHRGQVGGQCD